MIKSPTKNGRATKKLAEKRNENLSQESKQRRACRSIVKGGGDRAGEGGVEIETRNLKGGTDVSLEGELTLKPEVDRRVGGQGLVRKRVVRNFRLKKGSGESVFKGAGTWASM